MGLAVSSPTLLALSFTCRIFAMMSKFLVSLSEYIDSIETEIAPKNQSICQMHFNWIIIIYCVNFQCSDLNIEVIQMERLCCLCASLRVRVWISDSSDLANECCVFLCMWMFEVECFVFICRKIKSIIERNDQNAISISVCVFAKV